MQAPELSEEAKCQLAATQGQRWIVDEVEVFGPFGGDLPASHLCRKREDKPSGRPDAPIFPH